MVVLRLRLALLFMLVPLAGTGVSGLRAEGPAAVAAAKPRVFLTIDYQSHDTFLGAVRGSIAPTSIKSNTGAVFRNTIDPLNPLRYLTTVMGLEVQKQIASGEGIDVKKLVEKLDVKGIALGYLGAQGGEMLGAAAQSVLAKAFGPIGGFAGFTLRPMLWLIGSNVGMTAGKNLGKGGNPLKDGVSVALTEYNPMQDTLQMVGDNIGGVVGQALIPIPLVGNMVGGAIGGVAGLLLSKGLTATRAGKDIDQSIREKFKGLASTLTGETQPSSVVPEGYVAVPIIAGPGGGQPADLDGSDQRLMEVVSPDANLASRQRELRQAYRQVVDSVRQDPGTAAAAIADYERSRGARDSTLQGVGPGSE